MNRIKVVNDLAELAPMLMAVQTKIRREVLKEVTNNWCTLREIKKKFGKEGKKALLLFEKMKLVETRWQSGEGTKAPEKAYHTYYTSFHISASCPITEISDVLTVAAMSPKEYEEYERKIYRFVGDEGKFGGDVADELSISATLLKSLIKRSTRLEYRGHRVERFKE